jgi:hypothetical protein
MYSSISTPLFLKDALRLGVVILRLVINRFLEFRFGLGEDMLRPYKETIDRWLWPDAFSRQAPSIVKAKQAISNYKKAGSDPAGVAELMVFYCEHARSTIAPIYSARWFNSTFSSDGAAVASARAMTYLARGCNRY